MASPYDRVPPPSRRKPTELPAAPPRVPRPYTNGVHGQFAPPRPRQAPEEAFPPELQRRGGRGSPQPQYRQQPEPEYISQKREEFDEYYRQYDEGYIPPMPKKQKTSKIDIALLIGYIIVFAAGIGAAVLSFTYARGSTQLPMSISFIHLEIAALLVCQLIIALLVWRRG